jgi:hypothetical protein
MSDIATLTLAKLYESQNQLLDALLVYEKLHKKSSDEELEEKIIELREKIFNENTDSYDHLINNIFSNDDKAKFKILPHSQYQQRLEENTTMSNDETFPEDLLSEPKETAEEPVAEVIEQPEDSEINTQYTEFTQEIPEMTDERDGFLPFEDNTETEEAEQPTEELSDDDISDEEARRMAEEIAMELGESLPKDEEVPDVSNENLGTDKPEITENTKSNTVEETAQEIRIEQEEKVVDEPTDERISKINEDAFGEDIENSQEHFHQDLIDEIENIDNTISNDIENILNQNENNQPTQPVGKSIINDIENKWLKKRKEKESSGSEKADIQKKADVTQKPLTEIISAVTNENKLGIEIFLSEHFKSNKNQDEIKLSEIAEAIRIYKKLNEE